MQFVKFSLVGVLNTLISEGVYVIIVFLGGHYLVASIIGFSLSVVNAYYWNSRYVFKEDKEESHRVWWKAFLKTYVAYSGGQLLNMGLLILWVDIVKISRWLGWLADWFIMLGIQQLDAETIGEIVAAGINLVVTVPINYLLNKYWAFGKRKEN
ncbi:MAG: GtrA family protein [Lachnospiraceae bacterium]|nr:GtrA family protein [Lachnospiraceae bacterium]